MRFVILNSRKHLLPDVRLICLDLLEVPGALLIRQPAFPDTMDQCQAMEEQGITRMPMARRSMSDNASGRLGID